MKILQTFLLMLSLVVFAACGDAQWEESTAFDNDAWHYADSLKYVYHNSDTQNPRLLAFGVDLNADYPFRNLYVTFRTTTPSGKTTESMRQFILADPTGEWYVEKTMGGTLEFRQALLENIVFEEPGDYVFELKHYMRKDTLPGVEAVKLVVFDAPPPVQE